MCSGNSTEKPQQAHNLDLQNHSTHKEILTSSKPILKELQDNHFGWRPRLPHPRQKVSAQNRGTTPTFVCTTIE
ncbi:hypothetical protein QL285_013164 [Trifolium repens]|jgi:hypothetical protein|nr:hypothetical protein QL285_013164 [Trifolium repens]